MSRSARFGLASRIALAGALYALAAWWVLVRHSFDGAIVAVVTEYHGVHSTDWPALVFVVAGFLLVRRPTPQPALVRTGRGR